MTPSLSTSLNGLQCVDPRRLSSTFRVRRVRNILILYLTSGVIHRPPLPPREVLTSVAALQRMGSLPGPFRLGFIVLLREVKKEPHRLPLTFPIVLGKGLCTFNLTINLVDRDKGDHWIIPILTVDTVIRFDE